MNVSLYCKNDLHDVAWRTPLECWCTPKSTPFQSCFGKSGHTSAMRAGFGPEIETQHLQNMKQNANQSTETFGNHHCMAMVILCKRKTYRVITWKTSLINLIYFNGIYTLLYIKNVANQWYITTFIVYFLHKYENIKGEHRLEDKKKEVASSTLRNMWEGQDVLLGEQITSHWGKKPYTSATTNHSSPSFYLPTLKYFLFFSTFINIFLDPVPLQGC
jgi:hypothetical protein